MKSKLVQISHVNNNLGFLGIIESGDFSFEFKRAYFLTNIPKNVKRGLHGHKQLEQLLIPVVGSFSVNIVNKFENSTYIMDSPNSALFVPKMSWRELYNFSDNSCCLVLASEKYDKNDYVHDFSEFQSLIADK